MMYSTFGQTGNRGDYSSVAGLRCNMSASTALAIHVHSNARGEALAWWSCELGGRWDSDPCGTMARVENVGGPAASWLLTYTRRSGYSAYIANMIGIRMGASCCAHCLGPLPRHVITVLDEVPRINVAAARTRR